jgi:hypothetical protein
MNYLAEKLWRDSLASVQMLTDSDEDKLRTARERFVEAVVEQCCSIATLESHKSGKTLAETFRKHFGIS